ncbi:MAG: hypothetical protein RMY16_19830 [Nostoc sp. DedQUE12b]|uniref:hypothetical protein n=1 Tax=Nostoc sp. DedQUE12b TaxID=3075398 RepID=UPI002AD45B58|nr:hypothetical protein [Nostoc sp. DedQUE12b]MDZ8087793.1 hypothetical protein [Nostoc sp. DedQUE12b]
MENSEVSNSTKVDSIRDRFTQNCTSLIFQLGRHFLAVRLKTSKTNSLNLRQKHIQWMSQLQSDRDKIRAGGTGSNLKVFV